MRSASRRAAMAGSSPSPSTENAASWITRVTWP
jgi:hypothetical protein